MRLRHVLPAIASALAFSAPAHAVTAVSLEITNALGTWLQVTEVQAFDTSGTNVAAAINGGTASGAVAGTWNAGSTPATAIDGLTNGNFNFGSGIGTMYHPSTMGGANALLVNFAAPTDVIQVSIYGRSDCCSDRDVYNFRLLDAVGQTVASGRLDANNVTHFATYTVAADPALVPEPASWAMMIAGFGLVGTAMRRRKVQARIAFA